MVADRKRVSHHSLLSFSKIFFCLHSSLLIFPSIFFDCFLISSLDSPSHNDSVDTILSPFPRATSTQRDVQTEQETRMKTTFSFNSIDQVAQKRGCCMSLFIGSKRLVARKFEIFHPADSAAPLLYIILYCSCEWRMVNESTWSRLRIIDRGSKRGVKEEKRVFTLGLFVTNQLPTSFFFPLLASFFLRPSVTRSSHAHTHTDTHTDRHTDRYTHSHHDVLRHAHYFIF